MTCPGPYAPRRTTAGAAMPPIRADCRAAFGINRPAKKLTVQLCKARSGPGGNKPHRHAGRRLEARTWEQTPKVVLRIWVGKSSHVYR